MSGTFSGTFRNVRTKAECGDTIPAGTTTERVRNVRNVFRNFQECENKSRMRWHDPSGYYHRACQECQEHFQECSGMWEQKPNAVTRSQRVLPPSVSGMSGTFSGMFRNVRKACRACQECQEHFQERSGIWEQKPNAVTRSQWVLPLSMSGMSGTFSGMFRNVRTKAKCGDTIPAGTTTKRVRNVQSARRGQRWRMCSCTMAGLNVTCWSFWVIFGWMASLAILRLHLLGYYIQHA